MVFDGIVPVLTETPPRWRRRSTRATRRFSFAAWMAAFWPAGPEPMTRSSKSDGSGTEPPPEELVHDLRVCLALRPLHHLADEEAEHSLLAAAEGLDLGRMGGDDLVDDRLELGRVGDRGLCEVA